MFYFQFVYKTEQVWEKKHTNFSLLTIKRKKQNLYHSQVPLLKSEGQMMDGQEDTDNGKLIWQHLKS